MLQRFHINGRDPHLKSYPPLHGFGRVLPLCG
jgi:hypothetical protein